MNVANGASETKKEYKSLNRLIGREFSEEMVLLPRDPRKISQMHQVKFVLRVHTIRQDSNNVVINSDFAKEHADLRRVHDGLVIHLSENGPFRDITPIDTPFIVEVTYHLPDRRRSKTTKTEFVVPSINPRETGIETIWLCRFEMQDDEYLIDGEYDLASKILIRRPVVLLDLKYLHKIFRENGSLGEIIEGEEGMEDWKRLPEIPPRYIKVFDADIELRKRRLERLYRIQNNIHKIKIEYPGLSPAQAQDSWFTEKRLIEEWLIKYEKAFSEAHTKGLLDPRIRVLCPVSWKTIELIFAHRLLEGQI